MNNDIKISLSIIIKGGKRKQSKERYVIKTPKGYSRRHYFDEEPATLHINITKDAFIDMLSIEYVPYGVTVRDWRRMPKKDRLEWHLQRICDNFQGTSYSYEVLED